MPPAPNARLLRVARQLRPARAAGRSEAELRSLHERSVLPGDPPRVRKVPIQHHAQQEAAERGEISAVHGAAVEADDGADEPAAAGLHDLAALRAEAARAVAATPPWPLRTAAEMGGDVPYGERPAAGFTFTDAQVAHFCRQGYVVLRGVYDLAEVQRLREHASAALQSLTSQEAGVAAGVNFSFAPGPEQGAAAPSPEPDPLNPNRVAQVDDFYKMDAAIEQHMRCDKMTNALTELLGNDIDAYQVTTITKPARFSWSGGGYNFHQDIADYGGGGDTNGVSTTYAFGGMANFGNLCCITYLCDDCGPGTGSTTVVPGTHRWRGAAPDGSDLEGPVRRPLWTSRSTGGVWSGPFRTVEGWEELEERAVTPTFEAGDVLIFDSWVVHRANGNSSAESKIGLLNVYCRPDCKPRDPERWNYPGLFLPVVRDGRQVEAYTRD